MNSIPEVPAAADFGFPSPAADDINIPTPSLAQTSLAAAIHSPLWSPDPLIAGSGALLAPEPDVVKHDDVVTPGLDLQLPLSFDAVVGADVNPAPNDTLSLPSSSEAGLELRLPSFAALGLKTPHFKTVPEQRPAQAQDSLGRDDTLPHLLDSGINAALCDPISTAGLCEQVEISRHEADPAKTHSIPLLLPSPLHHFVTSLTPPDENGGITWAPISKFATRSTGSPQTESRMAPIDSNETATTAVVTAVAATTTTTTTDTNESAPVATLYDPVMPGTMESEMSTDNTTKFPVGDVFPSWLEPVIQAMLNNVQAFERTEPIKVLSHALPTPAIEGHLFPTIIHSLQDQTPTSPMCFINVFHALPGRFNLADVPRSPPSTPGPPIGGEDYFTSKVFDSAVRVIDYQDNLHTLPQSPSPIVPPSSVDVSIVERYIPPSSANEFSEMFNIKGPSILIDRLVELSPDNGTLIFIYPTKKGARTFTNDYLGPILEPLLRSIVIVNGFSADMASSAGTMAAAAALPDHDIMRLRVQSLCATLSQTSPRMEKFHRKQATFSLVYAAKEEVKLDRNVWADMWWCKQEKPRLRETINRYFRRANRASEEQTPPMIIQELLDGVVSNAYRDGEPTSKIEVSAFVIKRSG